MLKNSEKLRKAVSDARRAETENHQKLLRLAQDLIPPMPQKIKPIDDNWRYEENLGDGNCFWYSVIRSLHRRQTNTDPHTRLQGGNLGTLRPLNSGGRSHEDIRNLLTPQGVAFFKNKVYNHVSQNNESNKLLMSQIDHDTGKPLMENTVYGDSFCSQATANYLNCCIAVNTPIGGEFRSPMGTTKATESSFQIFVPGSYGISYTNIDPGVSRSDDLLDRNIGDPSGIPVTNNMESPEYILNKGTNKERPSWCDPDSLCNDDESLKKSKKNYREKKIYNALFQLRSVNQICSDMLFIQNINNGHYVALEAGDKLLSSADQIKGDAFRRSFTRIQMEPNVPRIEELISEFKASRPPITRQRQKKTSALKSNSNSTEAQIEKALKNGNHNLVTALLESSRESTSNRTSTKKKKQRKQKNLNLSLNNQISKAINNGDSDLVMALIKSSTNKSRPKRKKILRSRSNLNRLRKKSHKNTSTNKSRPKRKKKL